MSQKHLSIAITARAADIGVGTEALRSAIASLESIATMLDAQTSALHDTSYGVPEMLALPGVGDAPVGNLREALRAALQAMTVEEIIAEVNAAVWSRR
jgi:hypothetical protein